MFNEINTDFKCHQPGGGKFEQLESKLYDYILYALDWNTPEIIVETHDDIFYGFPWDEMVSFNEVVDDLDYSGGEDENPISYAQPRAWKDYYHELVAEEQNRRKKVPPPPK